MIIETMRMWCDVFKDTDHGLLAMLQYMQAHGAVEAGDELPTAINIGDESTDPLIARGRPAQGPALTSASIFFEALQPVDGPNDPFLYHDARISLGVRFDINDDESDIGVTMLSYLVRAAQLSTQWWLRDAPMVPWRVRNKVHVIQGVSLQAASFAAVSNAANNTYGVRLVVDARDEIFD